MNYKNILKVFLIMAVVVMGMACVSAGLFDDGDALKG